MITSAVRGVVVTALTTTLALFPTLAQAEQKDKDNDIERVELFGVNRVATWPSHDGVVSDNWKSPLDLYTPHKNKKSGKKELRYAGDGESECAVVKIQGHERTAQCTRVLRLKKGTLTLSDMVTYRPLKRVTAKTAIVGGTGHYRSAYGDGYITLDGHHVHLELNVDE
ncbi:hypothetical protein Sipo8835_26590 [Streptomyces ipomoeae]|uniref:Lipoprotein n=2 Tax=Streptomyces ipomoeae TaxID=103232 RepID=L1KW26_9ACTN|nr:hypothetical protein [Streptomyces ipomoeae]EKX64675.1 hypothetical protein STRIP9103_08958 [Streptomyces ipomoeae 91-03]MDX2695877.1 hypothetical protein [Streptomyces ipomoeae]MDX2824054.1 hypothetical protein [Streptomyces ipomoeae]MDX2841211.1 hypothetical protein [Streptomyces ipomoeae]MDX2875898.1 hypothetical protein [Streptomyces ipomoeae]